LKDGGPKKGDEIGKQVYDGFIGRPASDHDQYSDDNILGYISFDAARSRNAATNEMKHGRHRPYRLCTVATRRQIVRFQDGGSTRRLCKALYVRREHASGQRVTGDRDVCAYVIMEDLGMDFDQWLASEADEMKAHEQRRRRMMDIVLSDARRLLVGERQDHGDRCRPNHPFAPRDLWQAFLAIQLAALARLPISDVQRLQRSAKRAEP